MHLGTSDAETGDETTIAIDHEIAKKISLKKAV
jgi:hypothetical protein